MSSLSKEMDFRKETSEFMLQAMTLMRYDVLNLGVLDLQFGQEFLENERQKVSFPFLASNLRYNDSPPPWAKEYLITEAGGIKIGLIGVVDPERLPEFLTTEQRKVLRAIPPEDALNKLVPEVRQKADVVVLLSQFSTTELLELFKKVKGVDFSITAGPREVVAEMINPAQRRSSGCGGGPAEDQAAAGGINPDGPVLLYAGPKGMALGKLTIMADDKGAPQVSENRYITLDNSYTGDKEMAAKVDGFKKIIEAKEANINQQLTNDLQMNPEEFMEQYLKGQKQIN
jgi:2',3'-cyclic-nucleotide 2'-phosphodiesterase (5'-nucleotidase family)